MNCKRFWLALLALIALVAFGVLVIVEGGGLNTTQIALLSTLIALIGKDVGSAFAYFFDGTPTKPDTATKDHQ